MRNTLTIPTTLCLLSSICSAQTTNFTGNGSEAVLFDQLSFNSTNSTPAALVSTVASLDSINTSYSGGQGDSGDLDSTGGDGITLQTVGFATLTNSSAISGGNGGSVSYNSAGLYLRSTTGGNGISFNKENAEDYILGTDVIELSNIQATGGDGGSATGSAQNDITSQGGDGLNSRDAVILPHSGTFTGGNGGLVTITDGGKGTSIGGRGVYIGRDSSLQLLSNEITATGGNGGTVINNPEASTSIATGGAGFFLDTYTLDVNVFPTINGGSYQGGAGGFASGANTTADGGAGFHGFGSLITINDGMFSGGVGGSTSNKTGIASAKGGSAILLESCTTTINGGIFTGGSGGTTNETSDSKGFAITVNGGLATINGGNFTNGGLYSKDTTGRGTTLNLLGGRFEKALFEDQQVIDINGSTFAEDLVLRGSGTKSLILANTTFKDLSISSSDQSVLDLTIGNSTTNSGTVAIDSAKINVHNWHNGFFKDLTVNESELNFYNTSMELNNSEQFSFLGSNSTINVEDSIVLNHGALSLDYGRLTAHSLSINESSSLKIGLGTVTSSNITASGQASIATAYNNEGAGLMTASNNISIANTVSWEIYKEDNNVALSTNKILLAEASTINADLDRDNFIFESDNWLKTIMGSTNVVDEEENLQRLYAIYDYTTLDDALGIDGSTEYGKAMLDLSTVGYDTNLLTSWGQDLSEQRLRDGFETTTEMASMLIQQQALFADQIKDRSRSYLRNNEFGITQTAPSGANGPDLWEPEYWWEDTKEAIGNWFHEDDIAETPKKIKQANERLPSVDKKSIRTANERLPEYEMHGSSDINHAYMAARPKKDGQKYTEVTTAINSALPTVDTRELGERVEIDGKPYDSFVAWLHTILPDFSDEKVEVPTTWQMWGRAYGSSYEQNGTDGFAGYDATVYGGVIAMDKKYDHMLAGFGGGYAETRLNGKRDADADATTGYGTLYSTFMGDKHYIDLSLNMAYSSADTETANTLFEGNFDANTVGIYVGGGYAFEVFGKGTYGCIFTPEASMLTTYYRQKGYTETSMAGFGSKEWDSYKQMSYLGSVGASLSKALKINSFKSEMAFQPELRIHWLHEFNADATGPTYQIIGGNNTITAALQPREEDLVKVGGGVKFSKWNSESLEFGLDLDGTFGKEYTAYVVSGKLMHRF